MSEPTEFVTVPREPTPPATSAPADHWPTNLHPQTSSMVQKFSVALAKKLRLAEQKYGFADGWAKDDWENECRDHLYQHLDKGDPLDVAAYCAFMWHHRWHTHRASVAAPAGDGEADKRDTTTWEGRHQEALYEIANRASNYGDDDAADWMPSIYRIACEATGEKITPEEEARLVAALEYHKTCLRAQPPQPTGDNRELVERLRRSADRGYLTPDASREAADALERADSRLAAQKKRIEGYQARLEIDHVFEHRDGKKVRVDIPPDQRDKYPDGIN